ncbi:MAG TPA: hypothetical protein VLS44_03975, partial [Nitrospira sp.]|nr:hypothetical protein [Nitrospira sp.]
MTEPLRTTTSVTSAAEASQPILTHEQSLTKKIARGSEAGDIFDQQVLMLGTQLVTQLSILIKMFRIHGRTNAALDNPVETAMTVIATLAHEEPASIRLQNDFLFLGQRHLKVTSAQMPVFSIVIDTFNKWNIGGVSFASTTTARDLREFAFHLASLDATKHSLETLRTTLDTQSVSGIAIEER